jgi:hypothetical protein
MNEIKNNSKVIPYPYTLKLKMNVLGFEQNLNLKLLYKDDSIVYGISQISSISLERNAEIYKAKIFHQRPQFNEPSFEKFFLSIINPSQKVDLFIINFDEFKKRFSNA